MDELSIESRLTRIEEKQDNMNNSLVGLNEKYDSIIRQLLEAVGKIAVVDNATKSTHDRLRFPARL